jgi:HAD superfamily hydrolase (TIGR01509 family)
MARFYQGAHLATMAKAAIFDVDGTLLDSNDLHARAWQDAFRKWGKEIPFEKIRRQIGKGGDQLMPVFLSKEELEKLGHELSEWRTKHFLKTYLPKAKPFPKVRELFQELLRRGKQIALASSAKGEELEQYKRILHIEDLIHAQTTKDDAEKSKPHPDIFVAALGRLGVDADDAIAVGDTPYDAIACRRAGIRFVGLRCGGFPEEDLRREGCIAIYDDPADLLAHLDESPLR